MDRPPKRYLGPITITLVVLAVVGGGVFLAMQLSERPPEEIAGRTAPTQQTRQSDSSTAQDSRRSPAQQRAVPGLPNQ